jgi:hypothetical protein
MSSPDEQQDAALWQTLVQREQAFYTARAAFIQGAADRIGVVCTALRSVAGRGTALRLFPMLTLAERQEAFADLVRVASVGHVDVQLARTAILNLPREWVLERIEAVAEPLLQRGDYEEYQRLLELYRDLDPGVTRRLAERAAAHADPDVREAGEDFLAALNG